MNVLLLATGRALPASVVDGVRRDFAGAPDLVIDVVTWLPPAEPLDEVTRHCIVVGRPAAKDFRRLRRLIRGGVSRQFWARIRRRDDVAAAARTADVVVAMDTGAVRAGWHLARRHPSAVVTLGVTAAVRELDSEADREPRG